MIPSHNPIIAAIWMAVMVMESCLLLVLLIRKTFRGYPAFTGFILFCVFRSFLLLYVSHEHADLYRTIKSIAYVPQSAILIAVVLEVLYLVFHPFEALPAKTMSNFAMAVGIMAFVSLIFAAFHPGAQPTVWMRFMRATDQFVAWVLCSIFVCVALFATYFGIPWRHRVYGIGLGFLVYLSVDVGVTTAVAQFGLPPFTVFSLIDMLAFFSACAIWTYYFARREVARSVPTYEQIEKVRAVLGDFGNLLREFDSGGLRSRKH